jgi:hypothetical protein
MFMLCSADSAILEHSIRWLLRSADWRKDPFRILEDFAISTPQDAAFEHAYEQAALKHADLVLSFAGASALSWQISYVPAEADQLVTELQYRARFHVGTLYCDLASHIIEAASMSYEHANWCVRVLLCSPFCKV